MRLKRFFCITFSILVFCSISYSTNIIIIAVDTLRADHLGCYGYPRNTSPNIDEFARNAIQFKNCYTPVPRTGPAFASMLSSLPPHKHGAKNNGLPIFDNIQILPQVLKKNGYYSGAFVAIWTLKKKLCGLDKGFDDYTEVFNRKMYLGLLSPEGKAPKVNEAAFEWLEQNSNKKFFLWVHYNEPHMPYRYHRKFNRGYKIVYPSFYAKESNFRKIKRYDTEVGYVDFYIGELIKKIKQMNLYEDSLIIFLADHGEGFGEHNYYGHGVLLYNSTLHVPLIVKLPGNKNEPRIIEKKVSLMDVAPTILSLVDYPIPAQMEGENLFEPRTKERVFYFETYKGAAQLDKNKMYQIKETPLKYGLLKDDIKLILKNEYEAYDLTKDKFEQNDIFKNPDEKMKTLSDMLDEFVKEVQEYIELTEKYLKRKSQLSKEDIEKLRSLGYIKKRE
ncbi:MAG: sulfatase [Candidatus Aminicenantes bacterium]